MQRLIDAEDLTIKPIDTSGDNFDWNHYFHIETIYDWMDKIIDKYDFVEEFELGKTFRGTNY
jgi:hypothetical protein